MSAYAVIVEHMCLTLKEKWDVIQSAMADHILAIVGWLLTERVEEYLVCGMRIHGTNSEQTANMTAYAQIFEGMA
jgi:hypothetical protein